MYQFVLITESVINLQLTTSLVACVVDRETWIVTDHGNWCVTDHGNWCVTDVFLHILYDTLVIVIAIVFLMTFYCWKTILEYSHNG